MRTIETINSEISELKERMLSVKGTETEVYTRIVGYYRSVKNWNKGKRDEYGKRKLFSQPNRPSIREAAGTAVSTATFIDTPAPRRKALSASKGVITSYSIHYTKLYEIVNEITVLPGYSMQKRVNTVPVFFKIAVINKLFVRT